jgi:hypothetical protein
MNFLITCVIKNLCQIISNGKLYSLGHCLIQIVKFSFKKFLVQLSTHRLHFGRRGSKNVNKQKARSPIMVDSAFDKSDVICTCSTVTIVTAGVHKRGCSV